MIFTTTFRYILIRCYEYKHNFASIVTWYGDKEPVNLLKFTDLECERFSESGFRVHPDLTRLVPFLKHDTFAPYFVWEI